MGGRGGGGGAKEMEEGDCRSIGWSRRCSGLVCVCLSLSCNSCVEFEKAVRSNRC